MDYKTNVIKPGIKVENELFPEIDGLYFCEYGDDLTLFDFTQFIEENEVEKVDYKVFMRLNRHYIETISKTSGIPTSEMFYQNADGHILMVQELVFLFLMFVSPYFSQYFYALLGDVMADGVAYGNGFAIRMAANRVPDDILEEIIRSRKEEDEPGDE